MVLCVMSCALGGSEGYSGRSSFDIPGVTCARLTHDPLASSTPCPSFKGGESREVNLLVDPREINDRDPMVGRDEVAIDS